MVLFGLIDTRFSKTPTGIPTQQDVFGMRERILQLESSLNMQEAENSRLSAWAAQLSSEQRRFGLLNEESEGDDKVIETLDKPIQSGVAAVSSDKFKEELELSQANLAHLQEKISAAEDERDRLRDELSHARRSVLDAEAAATAAIASANQENERVRTRLEAAVRKVEVEWRERVAQLETEYQAAMQEQKAEQDELYAQAQAYYERMQTMQVRK
ncbi:unnamed protein product [Protopolystoma xenopodis]|uniref:Uncharacterized protein n=1 Tax=Protopolystoma xenopodis TaxID=117903 RepID=A0A3S5B148_9PLAT|nr:unnamed protein product [Protopolystoma xenopodis]